MKSEISQDEDIGNEDADRSWLLLETMSLCKSPSLGTGDGDRMCDATVNVSRSGDAGWMHCRNWGFGLVTKW